MRDEAAKTKYRFTIDVRSGTSLSKTVEPQAGTSKAAPEIAGMFTAIALGLREANIESKSGHWRAWTDAGNITFEQADNDVQEQRVYESICRHFGALTPIDLSLGNRRDSIGFLKHHSTSNPSAFVPALTRFINTTGRAFPERAKSAAIRFASDYRVDERKDQLISLLVDQLSSDSPSQASAAAVALSEVGDRYAVPAIAAAAKTVKWPSVKKDLTETQSELSRT